MYVESPSDCKIKRVNPKGDQSWIFIGRTDAETETPNISATLSEELTHLKRPWCWERSKAGGEGGDRGWDGWMGSPTWWTWVSANSGRQWRTGKPPVAAAAKSLQACPTLCCSINGSPPGSPVPGILQAGTLECCISFSSAWKWKVKVKSLSRVWLFPTPRTAAYQAPPSIGFSRQEHWSGVPLPSPGKPHNKYQRNSGKDK